MEAPYRILVADDSKMFRTLVFDLLSARGYVVRCVADGSEVLEAARGWRPDLFLLDVRMPAMDGVECCRRLKAVAELAEVPVLMLTAATTQEDIAEALRAGCDDYLSKPIDEALLHAKISSFLAPRVTREEPRRACALPVNVSDFVHAYTGTTVELGVSGMTLLTDCNLTDNVKVQVSFALPEPYSVGTPLQIFGRVIVASDDVVELEFICPNLVARAALDDFVRVRDEQPDSGVALDAGAIPPPFVQLQQTLEALTIQETARKRVDGEYKELVMRYRTLEVEHRRFSARVRELESENLVLSSLHVASYHLHSALHIDAALKAIEDTLANFAGARAFAIYLRDESGTRLRARTGAGVELAELPEIVPGTGELGAALQRGVLYTGSGARADEPRAAVPMRAGAELVGALVVYELTEARARLDRADRRLLELLGQHAALSILRATVLSQAERKDESLESVLKLLSDQS